MSETIWDREGLQILRRESEDALSHEYVIQFGGYMSSWADNPQELATYARSCYPEDGPLRAEVTMFLKQESNWNLYGVRA